MTDETDPGAADTPPAADRAAGATRPATASAAALASASAAQVTTIRSMLGPVGQMIVGGAIAIIVIVLVGAIVNAWEDSGSLAGVLVVAAVAAGAAAWFTARKGAGAAQPAIPLETIEFAAGLVGTILALLRVIEMLFDLDDLEDYGGAIGAVLTVGPGRRGRRRSSSGRCVATRPSGPRCSAVTSGPDSPSGGLALVVIAWALNLSIGFWNMNAAATPVAVLTFGAVLVVVQPRWLAVLRGGPAGLGRGRLRRPRPAARDRPVGRADGHRPLTRRPRAHRLPAAGPVLPGDRRDHRRRRDGRDADVAGADEGVGSGGRHPADDPPAAPVEPPAPSEPPPPTEPPAPPA